MELKDLKRGMKCVLRNGTEFLVKSVQGSTINYLGLSTTNAARLTNIDPDLTSLDGHRRYDIMEVFEPHITDGYVRIFNRDDAREMTVEQVSLALGYEVKIVK